MALQIVVVDHPAYAIRVGGFPGVGSDPTSVLPSPGWQPSNVLQNHGVSERSQVRPLRPRQVRPGNPPQTGRTGHQDAVTAKYPYSLPGMLDKKQIGSELLKQNPANTKFKTPCGSPECLAELGKVNKRVMPTTNKTGSSANGNITTNNLNTGKAKILRDGNDRSIIIVGGKYGNIGQGSKKLKQSIKTQIGEDVQLNPQPLPPKQEGFR